MNMLNVLKQAKYLLSSLSLYDLTTNGLYSNEDIDDYLHVDNTGERLAAYYLAAGVIDSLDKELFYPKDLKAQFMKEIEELIFLDSIG